MLLKESTPKNKRNICTIVKCIGQAKNLAIRITKYFNNERIQKQTKKVLD